MRIARVPKRKESRYNAHTMTDENPTNIDKAVVSPIEPVEITAVAPTPLLLLPAGTPLRRSLQHLTMIAALVLMFFASAGLTMAYFSTSLPTATRAQAASAATAVEDPFADISIKGQAAFIIDLTNNHVLYSKNPDLRLPLASLAKVALVLAVSEVLEPDTQVVIPTHATPDGAPIRLPAGLRFSAQDLIDFTLVASSNEGADILSAAAEEGMQTKYQRATGEAVLWRMNAIAGNLGLTNTVFLNTNGLDVNDTQAGAYGSAHDVALLFGYAALNSGAFGQTSRDSIKIRASTGESVTAVNTDEALPAIPGTLMGKTGSTQLAGGNLAVVFDIGPAHPVVAVVLHSTSEGRFSDMKKLVAGTIASVRGGE